RIAEEWDGVEEACDGQEQGQGLSNVHSCGTQNNCAWRAFTPRAHAGQPLSGALVIFTQLAHEAVPVRSASLRLAAVWNHGRCCCSQIRAPPRYPFRSPLCHFQVASKENQAAGFVNLRAAYSSQVFTSTETAEPTHHSRYKSR